MANISLYKEEVYQLITNDNYQVVRWVWVLALGCYSFEKKINIFTMLLFVYGLGAGDT